MNQTTIDAMAEIARLRKAHEMEVRRIRQTIRSYEDAANRVGDCPTTRTPVRVTVHAGTTNAVHDDSLYLYNGKVTFGRQAPSRNSGDSCSIVSSGYEDLLWLRAVEEALPRLTEQALAEAREMVP